MDPRERFSRTVDDYRRYRPDYPEAVFAWIGQTAGLTDGSVVVDIGCGTGISTRQLAGRGWRVIGVDPNAEMLEAAREDSEGVEVEYVRSDAETLALPLERCDAIVGGQAFHWFDLDRCLPRFRELLRGGTVVAFWNLRDHADPLMDAYEALLKERCPEYVEVGAEPRANAVADRFVDAERAFFPHHQTLDRDAFFGRVWSSSYVRTGVAEDQREGFDEALGALFDQYAEEGAIRFTYRTMAVAFRP
ncbi:MAG: class I SAM-dependent methyltransferase [Deltaproteobacteria bacterium]|nr:class I SAM-dependent methyltransferase [Deltaproteobacteria bacterium]